MKNKDNVEIKVGQEWKLNNGKTAFPLAFHRDGCLCYLPACGINCYKNCASILFHTLISDPDQPWLPLPDGYRLVTDEEREKYQLPGASKVRTMYHCMHWESLLNSDLFHTLDAKIAVPQNFQFEPVEPEKPKYKLFPIEFTQFQAETKSKPTHSLEVPCVVDEYRIFGYTDNEHWVEGTIALQKNTGSIDCVEPYCVETYDTRSCDETGNRKYAIGRLEG